MVKTDNLIRRTKFAKAMGVTPDTVDNWLDEQKFGLKRVKIGFSVYVDVSGFNAEKTNTTPATAADMGRKI